MRVAFIGVSHWHAPFYIEPALQLKGVTIVGVSDPDFKIAQSYAERLICPWCADYRTLCDRVKLDFVFALGRHCDIREEACHLIEAGIPCAMEIRVAWMAARWRFWRSERPPEEPLPLCLLYCGKVGP